MHCRGHLNSGEYFWDDDTEFINANSVRELSEYRLQIYKSILNGAVDYYTRQF
jgi:hypothetical protein